MAIQDFTAGQVLTAVQMDNLQANDYNQTVSTKTASYTLVAADKGTRVVMNSASATTITVNTSLFSAGDTLFLQNIGVGVCTVTAGTATVSSAGPLAIPQNGSGTLYFTSAGVSLYYPSAVTQNPSGLTFISATTIGTAVSSVAVSNVFSSTYNSYFVDISDSIGNGNQIGLLLGATVTGYYGGGLSVSTAGTVSGRGDAATTSFTNILNITDTDGFGLQIQIINPNLVRRTAIIASGSANGTGNFFSGVVATSTQYTGFTLTTTGTLTGGSIRVYGYSNS